MRAVHGGGQVPALKSTSACAFSAARSVGASARARSRRRAASDRLPSSSGSGPPRPGRPGHPDDGPDSVCTPGPTPRCDEPCGAIRRGPAWPDRGRIAPQGLAVVSSQDSGCSTSVRRSISVSQRNGRPLVGASVSPALDDGLRTGQAIGLEVDPGQRFVNGGVGLRSLPPETGEDRLRLGVLANPRRPDRGAAPASLPDSRGNGPG